MLVDILDHISSTGYSQFNVKELRIEYFSMNVQPLESSLTILVVSSLSP